MARRRRRRPKQKLMAKYVVRRVLLILVPLAVIGAVVWRVFFVPAKEPETEPAAAEQSSQPQPSEPEPQSSQASEPEPEPHAALADEWNLLLVNAMNPLPEGFEVELETVTGDYQVDKRIVGNLTRMINQARDDGISLMICSAYRSVEKQEQLFEARKQEYMASGMGEEEAVQAALLYTSRPGTSEHHTGLAVDIVTPEYQNLDDGYADTPAAKWLLENAADFGFILRYPRGKENITQIDFEPWHYRYVGEEHAAAINEAGYCLEEYLYVVLKDEMARIAQEQSDIEEHGPIDESSTG